MNGSVILNYLSQKHGANVYIAAELEFRGIKYYPIEVKSAEAMSASKRRRHELGLSTEAWYGQSIAWLKLALKNAEHKRLTDLNPKNPPKLASVTEVKPLSEELKQWLPKQWEIYKQRNGQVHDKPESNS